MLQNILGTASKPTLIPAYIENMHNLEISSQEARKAFEDGNFTVQGSKVPFTAVGVDQAQEYGNKKFIWDHHKS